MRNKIGIAADEAVALKIHPLFGILKAKFLPSHPIWAYIERTIDCDDDDDEE